MDDRLAEMRDDPAIDLVLDANALGGMLAGLFGADVTGSPGQCAHCHTVSMVGTMRAISPAIDSVHASPRASGWRRNSSSDNVSMPSHRWPWWYSAR